jgi:hypothetical protein
MYRLHAPHRLIATVVTALMATLTLVAVNAPAAEAVEPANAIRPGFNSTNLGASDDGSYPCSSTGNGTPTGCTPTAVPLGFSINFYGSTSNSVFVNNNGNLTLGSSLAAFSPPPLASSAAPIIAPFFADVDTRSGNTAKFGTGTVDGRPAWGVTWNQVRCYNLTAPINSFQVILIDRSDLAPGAFDVEYNYNQIVWDAGVASGGNTSNCVGDTSAARIGFAKGGSSLGTTYELGGSGTNDIVDGGSQSLTGHSLNSTVPGRYFFTFRNGSPSNVNKITTTLTAGSTTADSLTANVGTPVTLQSAITGVSPSASGTVTYRLYSNNVCSAAVGTAQTAGVTNGTVGSTAALNLAVGTYYVVASYSGDSTNPATSTICGANVLTIATNVVTISADNKSKNLGAADPAFTYTVAGLKDGDTLTSNPTCGVSGTHTEAGDYAIVCTGGNANPAKYTVARINGTLAVNKGNATITAANKTKVYGTASPAPTFATTGLVAGFPLATQPTCAIAPGENVGNHAITCSGASSPNYDVTYVPGTLSITPAPAVVKADPKTTIYGAADPQFTATFSGLLNGDTPPTAPSCSVPGEHAHVGTYDIVCTGPATAGNYSLTYVKSTLTVTRAGVTVTADPASHVYGQGDGTFTTTVTGLQPGDNLGFIPTCTASGAHQNVGQYPIVCSGPAQSGDYTVSYVPGTLTVTKKALTLVPGNRSTTYGGDEPSYGYTVSGLVGDDTLATAPTCDVAGPHSDAGSYDIVCSGARPGPNYTLDDSAKGTLTVTPAVLDVTARNYDGTYGQSAPAAPGYDVTGFKGDDALTAEPTCAIATPHRDAGSYPIACSGADAGGNYAISYHDGTYTVLPAVLHVVSDPAYKTYGQADPELTATTFGFVGEDTWATLPSCDVPTAHAHVGSYAVVCTGGDAGANYTVAHEDTGELAVTPKLLTLKPDPGTRVYGAADPVFTYEVQGLVGNDTLVTEPTCGVDGTHEAVGTYPITCTGAVATPDYNLQVTPASLTVTPKDASVSAAEQTKTYGTADPAFGYTVSGLVGTDTLVAEPTCAVSGTHTDVGDYPIVCTGADAGPNYTLTAIPAALHVVPATLTVTADSRTKTYASADPEFTFTTQGLVGDDQLTSQPVCDIEGQHRNVGTYDITCTGGSAGSNYTVVHRPGTLTVTQAAVLITADNRTKTYGTADPEFGYTVSGLADGEQLATAPTCAPAGAHRNVGSYDVVCSGAEAGGNYAISFAPGTLEVTKATVTVAAENKTKVYGAADPAFTRTVSGLVGDDTLVTSGSCDVSGAHTKVGTYPITCSGVDAGDNYTVTYVPGTLTVTKAAVAITADNKTKVYGTADPTFTYTVGGLVGADGLATEPTCTVAGAHKNVGTYPIVCSGATTTGDYDASYAAGTLTVTTATVTVTADNKTKVFGQPDPAFTATPTGLVPGDDLTTAPTCSVPGTHVSTGTYDIVCSGASAGANYTVAYLPGTLTITTAAQTITFSQPAGTTFEGADVPLSATSSSGLQVSFSSLTPATCSVVSGKAHPLAAGTCTIAANQSGNGIYSPATQVTRSLTIAKAPITVTTSSSSTLVSLLTFKVTYTTTVRSATTGLPVAGVPVTTRIDGGFETSGCRALTNAAGVATCASGPIGIALLTTYKAVAEETANYLGGVGSGRTPLL